MLVGYARVSTSDQDLTLQTDALTKAGCEKLFTDKVSGAKLNRPGLTEALNFVRAGDTLVIWKLDRLGRSIGGLIDLAADLSVRKISFGEGVERVFPLYWPLCIIWTQIHGRQA